MRNSDTHELHHLTPFRDVPVKRLPELRRLFTTIEAQGNTEVVRQGSLAKEFIVLSSGTATVVRDNKVVAVLGAGDVFGEMGMLTGDARNASVIVSPGTQMLAANRIEFRTMLHDFPEVADHLARVAAERAALN